MAMPDSRRPLSARYRFALIQPSHSHTRRHVVAAQQASRSSDLTEPLRECVREAQVRGTALRIVGGNSKLFLGRAPQGNPLELAGHRGVVDYEPGELVMTARAGTPLAEVEATLAEHGQMLAFEPPRLGASATLGGTIACGLSGPRRPYAGAARDFVLGVRLLNGRGEVLAFGGRAMKNVAGYDVSRLMVGAMGTLGVLLEVTLKVLPKPALEMTLAHESTPAAAIETMNRWAASPVPLSGACYDGERVYLRLSGGRTAVAATRARIGGEPLDNGRAFWERLREQRHDFFAGDAPLWRLSVPPATPPLDLAGGWLLDWGGALRWLCTTAEPQTVRAAASAAGGHAGVFRGGDHTGEVFHPLSPSLMALHRRLKQAFDPAGILNPGRMYAEL
jgi:glycolate oxidase FAD binding subunit